MEFGLRKDHCRTGVGKVARIRGLVIVDRVWKGHEHARHAGGRELGHCKRSRSADDHIGIAIRRGHVVDEREHGEGTCLVPGQAAVTPTMERLAEGVLVGALKAQLANGSLLADPIVYTLDEGTLSRYERRVLVR